MTRNDYQNLEMLGRVIAFCRAHDDMFNKQSMAGQALRAIEAVISKAYELVATQDRAAAKVHTDAKEVVRQGLIHQLEAIQRTALGVSIDYPGIENGFWIPGFPKHDQALLEAGDRFLKLLEPLKAAFVDHYLPEDFTDRFNATVENFRKMVWIESKAKTDRKGSFAQFSQVIGEGLKQLNRIDAVVTNAFHDDNMVLAAWDAARKLTKPRRIKRKLEPAADQLIQASPVTEVIATIPVEAYYPTASNSSGAPAIPPATAVTVVTCFPPRLPGQVRRLPTSTG